MILKRRTAVEFRFVGYQEKYYDGLFTPARPLTQYENMNTQRTIAEIREKPFPSLEDFVIIC